MTDEELDRLVHDADPYRPGVIARLDGAEQSLLEEIMSEPAPRRLRARNTRLWRTAAVLSAAAAITAVVTVPTLLTARHPEAGVPAAALSASAPSLTSKPVVELLKAGKVLLLMGEPGWKVTTVYGFGAADGTVVFAKGNLSLDVTWYQADYYDSYYQDRLDVSAPASGKVDGWAGDVFTYSDSDWEVMLRPRNHVFPGLRTSGPWKRADFDTMLAAMKRVDADTFLDAMPAEIVLPDEVGRAASDVLTDVPLPPGFQVSTLDIPGINDPYQFSALVVGRVGCGWLDEWTRGKESGDTDAVRRATAAMSSSHDWPVLKNMGDVGAFPQAFWDLADRVAAGTSPGEYRTSLNCS